MGPVVCAYMLRCVKPGEEHGAVPSNQPEDLKAVRTQTFIFHATRWLSDLSGWSVKVCNLVWSRNVNEIVSTHGYSQNQASCLACHPACG